MSKKRFFLRKMIAIAICLAGFFAGNVFAQAKYTVTVINSIGGSGDYEVGELVYIIAKTQEPFQFKNWTTPSAGVNFDVETDEITFFEMPASVVDKVA